jgi:ATP-dependent DNA helicase PIF1
VWKLGAHLFIGDGHALQGDGEGWGKLAEGLVRACAAPHCLELKTGAQVMLVRNLDLDAGLVNGARGVVEGMSPSTDPATKGTMWPVVRFLAGCTRVLHPETWTATLGTASAAYTQIPLVLAWAITIHKSQGASLDAVVVHLSNTFADGQAYVALSRARSEGGLSIAPGFSLLDLRCNAQAQAFYRASSAGLGRFDATPSKRAKPTTKGDETSASEK